MREPTTLKIGHERSFLSLSDSYDRQPTRTPDGELWALRARLRVPNLDTSVLVHLAGPDTGLPDFFAELAVEWEGWAELKEWRTIEGGLRLACSHDGRGAVAMGTELRDLNVGWAARAIVPLDAEELDRLAADVAALFS